MRDSARESTSVSASVRNSARESTSESASVRDAAGVASSDSAAAADRVSAQTAAVASADGRSERRASSVQGRVVSVLGGVLVGADVHGVGAGHLNLDGVGTVDMDGPVDVDGTVNVDGIRLGHMDGDLLDDGHLDGHLDMLDHWVWHGHLLGDVHGHLALNMDWHGDLHGDLDGLLVHWHVHADVDVLGDLTDLGVSTADSASGSEGAS